MVTDGVCNWDYEIGKIYVMGFCQSIVDSVLELKRIVSYYKYCFRDLKDACLVSLLKKDMDYFLITKEQYTMLVL